jgi:hypothetical protein
MRVISGAVVDVYKIQAPAVSSVYPRLRMFCDDARLRRARVWELNRFEALSRGAHDWLAARQLACSRGGALRRAFRWRAELDFGSIAILRQSLYHHPHFAKQVNCIVA